MGKAVVERVVEKVPPGDKAFDERGKTQHQENSSNGRGDGRQKGLTVRGGKSTYT